jgi:hypothetical protein
MATFQILTRRGRSKKVSQMMAEHQTKQRISLEEKQRGTGRFFSGISADVTDSFANAFSVEFQILNGVLICHMSM